MLVTELLFHNRFALKKGSEMSMIRDMNNFSFGGIQPSQNLLGFFGGISFCIDS